jgi:hypothetical protein
MTLREQLDNLREAAKARIPARFVIDRHGIVRAVDADLDYTHRPEPADTVKILEGLK